MSVEATLIIHYLRLACQSASVKWDTDNETELFAISDEIRRIAYAELADEITDLRREITDLRNRVTFVEQESSGSHP